MPYVYITQIFIGDDEVARTFCKTINDASTFFVKFFKSCTKEEVPSNLLPEALRTILETDQIKIEIFKHSIYKYIVRKISV